MVPASHDTTTGAHAAMTTQTLTIDAAELRRIALAVEKSAAKDDSRPALAGIQARIEGDQLRDFPVRQALNSPADAIRAPHSCRLYPRMRAPPNVTVRA
jgi:hypothetical protein